ncbi:MAG: hypothetical protein WBQ08_12195 [Candidatus Sulfotelmatobacter sp.]
MRKDAILTLFIMVALVLTLTFTVGAAGPKALAAAPVAAVPAPASPAAAPMPPHPRVEHALEALRSAKDHMAHAEGEFHGHRDKAIGHIDAAIHEAEICMQEP